MVTRLNLWTKGIAFDRESLEAPPPEVADYAIRSSCIGDESPSAEKRTARRFPFTVAVPVMPVDSSLRPVGEPFMAMTRNISTGGIALIHTRPITARHLVVELTNAAGERLQLWVRVLRCRPLGPFCDIAGEFVMKLRC
jgi:hypothetical protein